jgi:hypothetical protein
MIIPTFGKGVEKYFSWEGNSIIFKTIWEYQSIFKIYPLPNSVTSKN